MSGNLIIRSQQNGRDTLYRTSKLDTHLTHGCIQLFRQFFRVHSECAVQLDSKKTAIPAFSESALRTHTGSVS